MSRSPDSYIRIPEIVVEAAPDEGGDAAAEVAMQVAEGTYEQPGTPSPAESDATPFAEQSEAAPDRPASATKVQPMKQAQRRRAARRIVATEVKVVSEPVTDKSSAPPATCPYHKPEAEQSTMDNPVDVPADASRTVASREAKAPLHPKVTDEAERPPAIAPQVPAPERIAPSALPEQPAADVAAPPTPPESDATPTPKAIEQPADRKSEDEPDQKPDATPEAKADHYDRQLRQTRLEVAGRLAEIGPKLVENPGALKEALVDTLKEKGVDTDTMSPMDLNKLERHTIVSHMADLQASFVIEGRGKDARYKNPPTAAMIPRRDPLARAELGILAMMKDGRDKVRKHYSNPKDPNRQWWRAAKARYEQLGDEIIASGARLNVDYTSESLLLNEALAGVALSVNVIDLCYVVGKQVREPEEKVVAAHDTAYLLSTRAALSLPRSVNSSRLHNLRARIVRDKSRGKYVVKRHKFDNWRDVFGRGVAAQKAGNPIVGLKCPAHTSPAGPGTTSAGSTETSVERHVHAGINLAASMGAFGQAGKIRL